MRRTSFFSCACSCAILFLFACSDDEQPRSRTIEPAPPAVASKPVPTKSPLDQAVEDAIKRALKAEAARAAAADPHWATYPTLTDDSRRSAIPDEVPKDEVHVYLRGLGVHVPVDTLVDASVQILPDRVELLLQYPTVSVELKDWSESKEAHLVPEAWRTAAPSIPEDRWAAIETEVVSSLGDGGPGVEAIKRRVREYQVHSSRWAPKFGEEFDDRMKFMKAALWASPEMIDRYDPMKAYLAARLLMSKTAVVASVPGPREVPIAPVLGGPVFGLQRGRAGVDREVHGVLSGADGVWVEVRMSSSDSKPIAESEAFVNGFFDTMRPFEQRVNDAAALSAKVKEAQKTKEPAARRRAALLALAAFHLDPRGKRAEALVKAWRDKDPAPNQDQLAALVEQIATWSKAGPAVRKDLQDAIKEKK
jgi:hypothetical protein